MADAARSLADLVLAAGNLIVGNGSPRQANGMAVITSSDRTQVVTALVPANWIPGPAIAAFDQASRQWIGISAVEQGLVDDRLILSERHVPNPLVKRDIGPLWGVDVYQYYYDQLTVALHETGKATLKAFPDPSFYSYLGVIDVDENGPHAFIPVYPRTIDKGDATRAFVLHGSTWLDIEFPGTIIPYYVAQSRMCNGHFWSFPTGLGVAGRTDERGYTYNIKDIQSAEDVEFFDITSEASNAQGSVLGVTLGSLVMSGATPSHPGGPSYPFRYDYQGHARNVRQANYASIPNVVNAGILSPPVEGDEFANAPIKRMVFPLTGGIITPGILVVDDVEYFVSSGYYLGIVSWTSRAIWDQTANTITLELRSSLYADFSPSSASLVGQVGRVTYAEGTCSATYTLPMLSDLKTGRLILEQFDGEVYYRQSNQNENPTTAGEANEAYCTEAGVHRTFLVTPEGEKNFDPSWQHSIYLPSTAIPRFSDIQVGQAVTMQFESLANMGDAYVSYTHPNYARGLPGMFLGVPGLSAGKKLWSVDGSYYGGGKRARYTRNVPRPEHAAALEAKLAPGARVYGILYENNLNSVQGYPLSTIFKGVITSSDYSLVPVGAAADPNYVVWRGDYYRARSGATYHLGHLNFEITEVVSNKIEHSGYEFFGDYWWGKVPFGNGYASDVWVGNVFLDGSLRNIYPTEAYNAAWLAHAYEIRPKDAIAEGTFEDTFVGTKTIWEGDYIWRFRRNYDESAGWEGYIDGDNVHPVEVPRWKLDTSGPEVKCWFDGVELLDLKSFREDEVIYADNFSDLSFDRKMVLKNLGRD